MVAPGWGPHWSPSCHPSDCCSPSRWRGRTPTWRGWRCSWSPYHPPTPSRNTNHPPVGGGDHCDGKFPSFVKYSPVQPSPSHNSFTGVLAQKDAMSHNKNMFVPFLKIFLYHLLNYITFYPRYIYMYNYINVNLVC